MSHTTGVWLSFEAHRRLQPSRHDELVAKYRKKLCAGVFEHLGVVLSITDEREPSADGGALVAANHSSVLDVMIMLHLFRGVMVSRADVKDWPLLGRLAQYGDTIFVDRENTHSGVNALRAIRGQLKRGTEVVLFPEGGTHAGKVVQPFHPGGFAAAASAQASIVPVGMAYRPETPFVEKSFAQHAFDLAGCGRISAAISIGAAIEPTKSAQSSAEHTQRRVQELVDASYERLAQSTA